MLSRKRVPELMDDPKLDAELHHHALEGLEKLNELSASASIIWSYIRLLSPRSSGQQKGKVRVLDLAAGGGDVTIAIAKLAAREQFPLEIVGADISETAKQFAQSKVSESALQIKFLQLDALNDSIDEDFDAVICSLFTHHLDPPEVVALLKKMKGAARQLVIVNDLVRNEMSYALVWLATRVFSKSPVVHFDGPVSVRASYTFDEMEKMALEAGLDGCRVSFLPPCRQLLVWKSSQYLSP